MDLILNVLILDNDFDSKCFDSKCFDSKCFESNNFDSNTLILMYDSYYFDSNFWF